MGNLLAVVLILFCLLGFLGVKEYPNVPANPEEMQHINMIVGEASNSPDGKALIDFIKEKQSDGITKKDFADIASAYEDWKLFYSLKVAEGKYAVEQVQNNELKNEEQP